MCDDTEDKPNKRIRITRNLRERQYKYIMHNWQQIDNFNKLDNLMKTYRLSDYSISTKLDDVDKHMLVHGYTGAIDIVSSTIGSFISSEDNSKRYFSENDVPFSKNTFNVLIDRGYITTKTSDEEHNYVIRMAKVFHEYKKRLNNNYMFLVAYECNFRCPYCYENNVSGRGKQWSKMTFTKEMVDRAYDAMLEIEPERKLHNNHIILYGGEPLLSKNLELIEYIVKKGIALGYTFGAVTNGYDLADFKELIAPDKINFLQIAIDGIKEHHNKRRIHFQEENTFDRIIENIGIALKQNVKIGIRVNTDHNNFEDLSKLYDLCKKMGYTDNPKFTINSALLIDYKSNKNPEPKLDADDIKKSNGNLNYMCRKDFNQKHKYHNFKYGCQDYGTYNRLYKAIESDKKIDFGSIFCGAQAGMYIFDPFGDIYGCWSYVGDEAHIIGSYKGAISWTENKSLWQNKNIGNTKLCSHCKYAFLCMGGCLSHALLRNGDLNTPDCNEYNNTFEYAVNRLYRNHFKK